MTLKNRNRWIAGSLALLLAMPAGAAAAAAPAAADSSPLTLEQIMADPDWFGNLPEDPYWSDDGTAPLLHAGARGDRAAAQGPLPGGPRDRKGRDGRSRAALAGGRQGERNLQGTRKVYVVNGDVWVKNLKTGERAAGHPPGRRGGRSPLPGRRPADLVPPGDRRVRLRRGVRPALPARGAEAGEGPRREDADAPGGAADPSVRRDPPEAGPGEAGARGGPGPRPGRSQPDAVPLVPGQDGEGRGDLPLPRRRLAGGGPRPQGGGGGQAGEDAAVRDRERQRGDQGRPPQGRRGEAGAPHAGPARPPEARAARHGPLGPAGLPGRPPEGAAGVAKAYRAAKGRTAEKAEAAKDKTAEKPDDAGKKQAARPLEVAHLEWSDDGSNTN